MGGSGLACTKAFGCVGLGLGCSSGHLVAILVVGPLWVKSEETVLVMGTPLRSLSEVLASLAREGQWPCLCVVG